MDKDSEKQGVVGGGPATMVESHTSEKGSGSGGDGHHVDEHDNEALHYFTAEEQRRIIRSVDRRLITTLGFLYCVSLMDRTNLGAANIAGMAKELTLVGDRYSIVSLVFFTTYIVFQPPSTIIVRWLGPRIHLAGITVLWGTLMIGMGFVTQWDQLAALRVVLGILEAGFFPSCVYLLSTWYTRCKLLPPSPLPPLNWLAVFSGGVAPRTRSRLRSVARPRRGELRLYNYERSGSRGSWESHPGRGGHGP